MYVIVLLHLPWPCGITFTTKVRCRTLCDHSEESAPTMPALVNGRGTFDSVAGGTFQSDTDGTFHSDLPGTFESDMSGTFKVMQSYIVENIILSCNL